MRSRLHYQKNEEGFTLIELMIVVVIIGILAAIAIPIFMNQQKAAQLTAVKSDVKNTGLALQTFATKGKYPTNETELKDMKIVVSNPGNYDGTRNNYLVCTTNGGPSAAQYAVMAVANDGKTLVTYSSQGGLKTSDASTFPVSFAEACANAGVVVNTADGTGYGFWGYGGSGTKTWYPWTNVA